LHGQGIAHRDIKLENILMQSLEPLYVKVADFGLAKVMQADIGLKSFTGTLAYMAPEVARMEEVIIDSCPGYTHNVDNWSLGTAVYLM
ncbi:kinase-like protein, partial [Artomyces pyxidatus]